jgi:hypothetical protein
MFPITSGIHIIYQSSDKKSGGRRGLTISYKVQRGGVFEGDIFHPSPPRSVAPKVSQSRFPVGNYFISIYTLELRTEVMGDISDT